MSSDESKDTERLLAELLEATQKAQSLAVDVKKSLRADREVGRSVRPEEDPTPGKRRRVRRQNPDRRTKP
jgi:hypothetical protein